jgi:drug/metabolite transporter (DMT)-like permease
MVSAPAASTGLVRTVALTVAAMIAFAANSILCRLALAQDSIDAASFTAIRLASGAVTLGLILAWRNGAASDLAVWKGRGSWTSAVMLFAYAIAFSLAYRSLTAGTGALLLFGLVQLTMLLAAIATGERPPVAEWIGLALAIVGLVWLVLPGLSAPDPGGAVLMGTAGVAWGVYSLRGRRSRDAMGDTAGNFVRAMPLAGAALIASGALVASHVSPAGLGWALLSGAVTSGLGYVIWYAALRGLTAVRAAIVQLSVPVLAALGGVLFLREAITPRLLVAAALILGGIALAVWSRRPIPR